MADDGGVRLLHVIPTLDHVSGGPSRALVGLAIALRQAGANVALVVEHEHPDDPTLIDQVRAADVPVRVLRPPDGSATTSPMQALREEIGACDVCHIHAVWENVLHQAAVACRELGRPHVFRTCGMLDAFCLRQHGWKKRLYIAWRLRRDLDQCSAIHFTTRTEWNSVRSLGFRAPGIVEANGVAVEEFGELPAAGTFRRRVPEIGDRPIVLIMSRLNPIKGFDLLIPAFASLRAKDAVLVIVGPDEAGYRGVIEAMVATHGIESRVVFTGAIHGADRVAALVDADLFVLPSYHENFGVAVVEALAASTPAIVSNQVSVHGEITAAQLGAVVPLEAAKLGGAIDEWLADDAKRAAASARCRPFVHERFEWGGIARRWIERYDLLARGLIPDDVVPS